MLYRVLYHSRVMKHGDEHHFLSLRSQPWEGVNKMKFTNTGTTGISRRSFISGITLVAAVPAVMALTGCGSNDTESASSSSSSTASSTATSEKDTASSASSDTSDVVLEGDFILGFDQDFPPYGYVGDDGEFTGFDIELAKAVCEMEGWTIDLEPINWDSKDALLNSGQITCIWNGFTIEGREDDYSFTAPYMENRQVIAVRTDSGINSLADLAGKIVVTQTDSAALELLSDGGAQAELGASFGELQTIGEYNTAFMELESGSVDAVALDAPVATFNIGDRTDTFKVLDEALNSEHFGVGFKKGNDALAKVVEDDLRALNDDGTVEQLCDKYADQGVSYDEWLLK